MASNVNQAREALDKKWNAFILKDGTFQAIFGSKKSLGSFHVQFYIFVMVFHLYEAVILLLCVSEPVTDWVSV